MIKSQRFFKLWHYSVSHGYAVVRSPRDLDNATNIDILFFGVEFLSIPSSFVEIEVCLEATDVHLNPAQLKKYLIKTGDFEYFIVAAGCKLYENCLDIFDLSPYK